MPTKTYPIVAICGKAGSGKNASASFITDFITSNLRTCSEVSLADPLKRLVAVNFGISPSILFGPSEGRDLPLEEPLDWNSIIYRIHSGGFDELFKRMGDSSFSNHFKLIELITQLKSIENLTPRKILQTIGTEFARSIDADVWINWCLESSNNLLMKSTDLVVIPDCRFRNEILKVKQLGGLCVKLHRSLESNDRKHKSETEQDSIPNWFFDKTILNHWSLEELQHNIVDLIKEHYGIV